MVKGFISSNKIVIHYLTQVATKRCRITHRPRGQKEFNRLSVFGNQDMHPNAIEKTLFAGDLPTPGFTLVEFTARNAVVVTGGNRVAVQNVARTLIEHLPVFAQREKESQKQLEIRCTRRLKQFLLNLCGI